MSAGARVARWTTDIAYRSGLNAVLGIGFLTAHAARLSGASVPDLIPLAATALYAALYLGDRLAEANPTPGSPAAFAHGLGRWAWAALAAFVGFQVFVAWHHPRWGLATVLGVLVCLAYFLPVPLLGRRVKDIPFAKNLWAPFAALVIAHLYAGRWPIADAAHLAGLLGLAMSLHASNALYDLKDVESDAREGVLTLPIALGARRFALFEAGLCATALLGALLFHPAPAVVGSLLVFTIGSLSLVGRDFDARHAIGLDGAWALVLIACW